MDRTALEEGFRKFGSRLQHLASRTLNPHLAGRFTPADVLQETMMAAARDEGDYLNDSSVPIYLRLRVVLLQVVQRLERQHLATLKRDAFREAPPEENRAESAPWIERIPSDATSPVSRLARDERAELLHAAVARLGSDDQAVLELRHDEGLSNYECAALLDLSPAAASARYVRALQHLKAILIEYSEFRA